MGKPKGKVGDLRDAVGLYHTSRILDFQTKKSEKTHNIYLCFRIQYGTYKAYIPL